MSYKDEIEVLLKETPTGPLLRAHTNNVFGLNHRSAKTPLHHIKQKWGYVFFTRPQLNLQSDNIRADRRLYHLLSDNIYSPQRTVRCFLDPRLKLGYGVSPKLQAPLVDNRTAFIPILYNNLKTLTGWNDEVVPIYTTKPGLMKEEYTMVDGAVANYNKFTLTATYDNTAGNLLKQLFTTWTTYMGNVFSGKMTPYPDFIVENELDYNTRIYRIVLDHTGQYVDEIAMTGASLPSVNPVGSAFDYSNQEGPYNEGIKEISLAWECNGVYYNDPLSFKTFNDVVQIFNPKMKDDYREQQMAIIPYDLLYYFNFRGYPRINPINRKMEWWIDKEILYPPEVLAQQTLA